MSWESVFHGDFDEGDQEAWGALIRNLHGMQAALASMQMDRQTIDELSDDLAKWRDRLAPLAGEETEQVNGRVIGLPVRGHAMLPELKVSTWTDERVEGVVTFDRFHMGGGMAAHGGVVALLFDEVLGIQAGMAAATLTRTAYLKTDYRALTPIDEELEATAWVESIEGRKIIVRGELRHHGVVCAEAEGLFLTLLPDQGLGKRTTDPQR